jgi:hypothetical protein
MEFTGTALETAPVGFPAWLEHNESGNGAEHWLPWPPRQRCLFRLQPRSPLVQKFGPNTKPFPRTYVPPEITEFFTDPEATFVLDRSCTSCHSLDRVMEARNSPDQWRVIAVDMRERGAKLTDEELERLVEWLGRVKGINNNQ